MRWAVQCAAEFAGHVARNTIRQLGTCRAVSLFMSRITLGSGVVALAATLAFGCTVSGAAGEFASSGAAGGPASAGHTNASGGASSTGGTQDGADATCSVAPVGPRQLRLLTRREYRNTVNDLFQLSDPAATSDLTSTFPVESHPRQQNLSDVFPFDDSSAQVVSTTHVAEYWRAGQALATAHGSELAKLAGCTSNEASACAPQFVKVFGQRAFRRPLTAAELARYTQLASSSNSGLVAAARAFLSSPKFLYRSEGAAMHGNDYQMDGYEVASALSYTFWGTMPDEALFAAAAAGQLVTSAQIETQARRLLADARSRAALGLFASQWLGAEDVLTVDKQASMFPGFDAGKRALLLQSTRSFVSHVAFDSSGKYPELLQGDSGLLTQPSLLAVYARSDQTSPIKRGLFVRRRLLCQDLPPPPANVPPVPSVDQTATTRERFAQHTSVATCAACHRAIDPIGFGFEHYDAVGNYRDLDNGLPVDASGDMNDVEGIGTGTSAPFSTLAGLAQILTNSAAAPNCLVTQLYRFGRGAFEGDATRCAVQQARARFRDTGFDIREAMVALTQTSDFINRR